MRIGDAARATPRARRDRCRPRDRRRHSRLQQADPARRHTERRGAARSGNAATRTARTVLHRRRTSRPAPHSIDRPPQRLRQLLARGPGFDIQSRFPAVDDIDYALCVRRIELDASLVTTARRAEVDVREHCRVTQVIRRADRVVGVGYRDSHGNDRELHAPLVIGADGRKSTIARLIGVERLYRSEPSGRDCYFRLLDRHRLPLARCGNPMAARKAFGHSISLRRRPGSVPGAAAGGHGGTGTRSRGHRIPRNDLRHTGFGRAPVRLPDTRPGAIGDEPVVILPPFLRAGMSATRRCGPFQGSGHRPGDSRRTALRPAAR